MRGNPGHCPDTQQSLNNLFSEWKIHPLPRTSTSVSQRCASQFIFYSTLHQRLQSYLWKVLYLYSFYSLCRKMHEEWHHTKQWFNGGIESRFLTRLPKIPTAKAKDWHTPVVREPPPRTAVPPVLHKQNLSPLAVCPLYDPKIQVA